jgi:hypothetical protein
VVEDDDAASAATFALDQFGAQARSTSSAAFDCAVSSD